MKLQKPSWIHHDGHPIFSVDIHPSSPRFATGGQGADSMGRVVIWGMGSIELPDNPIISPMAKFLCQLDHHSACVNCVRWSNKGKYLASGGDDKVIMIWELKGYPALHSVSTSQNSCFGKSALETWKPVFTLRCHTGDVLDLAWSPDDRYLASASVDNSVLIWDALKFPTIVKEIQGHTSLVKGVTWDPVGSYLATQSDDQTLKIWRTSDWKLEHSVTESFKECGGTTHVLRLDWSPDGGYLVSAHAMNCGGPTAQIVERDGWKTDKDFVGHRKAVVCVRFTRAIIQRGKSQNCYVALGSRDRSLSVWSTGLKRPLVVIRDAFTNSVMDIAWSSDGKMMMACSGDGSVVVAAFTREEIGEPLSQEEMISLHQRVYGKKLNYLSNSSDQLVQSVEVFMARKKVEKNSAGTTMSVIPDNEGTIPKRPEEGAFPTKTPERMDAVIRGPTDKQIETRTADGKRRITPKFLLPQNLVQSPAFLTREEVVFGAETRSAVLNDTAVNLRDNMVSGIVEARTLTEAPVADEAKTIKSEVGTPTPNRSEEPKYPEGVAKKRIVPTRLDQSTINGSQRIDSAVTSAPQMNGISSAYHNGEADSVKAWEKNELQGGISQSSIKPGGNDRVNVPMKRRKNDEELVPPKKTMKSSLPLDQNQKTGTGVGNLVTQLPALSSPYPGGSVGRGKLLAPLKITDSFTTKIPVKPTSSFQLEVSNGVNGTNWMKCQHEHSSFEGLYWAISTDAPICVVAADSDRIAAACEDATVHILDLKGRYSLPPFLISSLPTKFCLNGAHLLIVTVKATLHVWNVRSNKSIIKSESISSLLNFNSKDTLQTFHATVMQDGSPLVILSNGKRFLFNFDMQAWVSITESAHSLSNLRKTFDGVQTDTLLLKKPEAIKKETSITFIKLRLASAIHLLKAPDVQNTLILLAKALATKGYKRELHILCEDLLGPTHSASASSQTWAPELAGVNKRKVLREILNVLISDLQWQDFFIEFDEMLQLVETGESVENGIRKIVPESVL